MMTACRWTPTAHKETMTAPSSPSRRRPRRPVEASATVLSGVFLFAYAFTLTALLVLLERKAEKSLFEASLNPGDDTLSKGRLVPRAVWPTSIVTEEWEEITHPADASIQWRVPRFWSPPLHHQQLLSRSMALQVGTCTQPDADGRYQRGTDCPLSERTIFLMIASYRDFECRSTVESVYQRAMHPDRVRVGIVDQIVSGIDTPCHEPLRPCHEDPDQTLCRYRHLIDRVELDARQSVGPVPARHVGHRMYRGEYYAAQTDAHVTFTNGWDGHYILELEATGNEMAVLSTYLSDIEHSIDEHGDSKRHARPIMCNSYWKEALGGIHIHHSSQPESHPTIHGMPQLHPWWSAGFSFSRGHFVINVPYDLYQAMLFSGEELAVAVRGWTVGYDFYAPEKSYCFHHYKSAADVTARRKDVPLFWENAKHFAGAGERGMRRLLSIVHLQSDESKDWDHTDVDIYGLGGVRTPEQLWRILGFHVEHKTVPAHLCEFVESGLMHSTMMAHLRGDGMGIDYNAIDYQWQDEQVSGRMKKNRHR